MKRILNGDRDAFRLLVNEYKNLVYVICLNAVHDSFEAENLAQETFLQVYKSLPGYEFRGLKTWISRIALNKSIDYKRRLLARKNREMVSLADIERMPDDATQVQDFIIKQEETLLLAEALSKIPVHYANVLRKSYLENKNHKQIAEEEDISIRTVETRLYRGKKILREQYEELSKS